MKQNMDLPSCKWNLLKVFFLICTTLASTVSFGQLGNAPMQQLPAFPGLFAIDGYLQRQGANGDWLQAAGGSANNFVLTNAGAVAPLIKFAFLKRDLFNDLVNDEIFDGGNKLNDNPNDWGWRSQKPPGKDDINNAAGFLALNPIDQHIWLAISGDRMETNGTSYIDFEFYQNEITRTGGPIPGGTGGFTTAGPHNGRTVGDLSLTLEFTGGGSLATIKYLQWQPGNEAGTYDYFPLNPPAGSAFAAANDGVVNVPYGAFGGTTYAHVQWAEGAVDLTALIGGSGSPGQCGSQPFESLFIKTKSSSTSTADLKDFISPFGLNTCFDETPPVITCAPTLNLGCNPTIPAPSGTTASDNCNGVVIPVSADGPVTSTGCSRSMTRTWRATDNCGNTATCGQQINWTEDNAGPVITTGGTTTTLGCNPVASDINAALGTATATDACSDPTVSAPSDGTVSSDGCTRTQTRTWTARDACSGITTSASRTVSWKFDNTPPVITTGGTTTTLGCNPTSGEINGALGTATATDGCGTATVSSPSDGTVGSDGCTRTQTRKWTAVDACGNTSTASRSISWKSDNTPPVITTGGTGTSLGCNPTSDQINAALGTATATDGCGAATVSAPSDGTVSSDGCGRSQTRKWTAIDACGNTSTASRTVNWTTNPAPPVFTSNFATVPLACNPVASDILIALGDAIASSNCGTITPQPSDAPVISTGCARSRTRTFFASDGCGNTATASRTVTWTEDITPPVITTGGTTTTLGCNPTSGEINGALGTATATDGCGTATVSAPSDGTVGSENCTRTQTRKWTAIDACGNTSTASRTVSWTSDNTAPVFTTTPASVDIACNDPVPTAATPTASDACGTPTVTQTGNTDNATDCSTGFGRVVTRTWTARDACGNTATYTQTIRVACCPSQFCTYTQGAYGTDGGTMCDGEKGDWSTLEYINNILGNYGGSFSVGKPGASVLVNSAQCVIDKLPGGGGSKELVAGDVNLCAFTPLQPNGGVKNVLLAQTITLKLNLGIENSQLASFVLQAGELAAADPVNGCGDENPKIRVCHYNTSSPYNLISVDNEYTYRTFYQNVIDAIPGANTVGNLLELANRALANVDGVVGREAGVSIDSIQKAVASVNEVFDQCKIFIGWNVGRCAPIDPTPGDGRIASTTVAPALEVSAFPNPYEENFSLKINSPVTGQASISFYTMSGVKIGELKRDVVAKKDVWVPYRVPAVYRTRIVYTVNVGSHNAKGIVLSPN